MPSCQTENHLKVIAYLLYGSRREYHLELTYSVLSAMHFIGSDQSAYRVVLITDEANRRRDLPVEHLIFSSEEFNRWTRNETYMYEAKVHALTKAMDHFKCPVALVDTDTYFLDHPQKLFQQVGPGKSVMHALEGNLGNLALFDFWVPLLDRITAPVVGYTVNRDSLMFNSGVVGVDFSDRHVLDDVPPLIHALYAIYPLFNIEQFAFAAVLSKHTRVGFCPEIVYHYFGYERAFIHLQVGELFPTFSSELFNSYVDEVPRLGYPGKRRSDQLKAALIATLRHHSKDYRFAYLAYLCALSKSESDPPEASVWAHTALSMLRHSRFPTKHIKSDFRKMQYARNFGWLKNETKQDWIRYWDGVVLTRDSGHDETASF
jgi:hypothetical protein